MGDTKKLLQGSTVVFIGTIAGSVFSYLFNAFMGRKLGPQLYGEVTSLLSLFAIGSVLGTTVMTVVSHFITHTLAQSASQAQAAVRRIRLLGFSLAFVLFLLGIVLAPLLRRILSITNFSSLLITAAIFSVTLLLMSNRGILQGSQHFFSLAGTNFSEMFLRFLGGTFLIIIGLSIQGALLGILFGVVGAYIVSSLLVYNSFKHTSDKEIVASTISLRSIVSRDIFPTFAATLMLAIILNIDIILVKFYTNSTAAGLYSAISTVAKIIFFVCSPAMSVMFPMISEKWIKGEKHYITFLLALAVTTALALSILAIYVFIPGKIVTLLYGKNYVQYYYLLPQAGTFMVCYSLVNVMTQYYLAIRDRSFIWFYILTVIAQVGLVSMFHTNVEEILRMIIITTAGLFFVLFVRYLLTKRVQLVALLMRNA